MIFDLFFAASRQPFSLISSFARKRCRFLSFLLACFAALVAIGASPILYPQAGLDPSWQQALVEATDSGRVFGRDVIFTYGPLHQAVTDRASRNLGPLILGKLLFSFWFLAVLFVGIGSGIWAASSIVLSLVIVSGSNPGPSDLPFYLFSLVNIIATCNLSLSSQQNSRESYKFLLAIVFASGILLSTLVKLCYIGAAIPSLLVIVGFPVLDLLRQRSLGSFIGLLSVALVPIAVFYVAWGIAVGWSMRNLFGYFNSPNLDIIKGYADAMSYGYSLRSIALVSLYWAAFDALLCFPIYFRFDFFPV